MSGGGYRVTAGYATVETAVDGGRASIDIPRGSMLPGDVPHEQVETLLLLGHVEVVKPARKQSKKATVTGES